MSDDDVVARIREALLAAPGTVNLTGPLGVGKSALVRGLPGAVVVDLDHPGAGAALRAALAQRRGPVVADNADGRQRLGVVRAALDTVAGGRLVVVTRTPVRSRPGWSGTTTVTLPPVTDAAVAAAAAAAGVPDRDVAAVVRLAAGVPLLAEAAARALHRGIPVHPEGPLADHVAAEVLERLGRELPGRRWLAVLRVLATVRAGDERLLRGRPDQFAAVADLSLVQREPAGLVVAEPYRGILESAYRWRDPATHESVRTRASAYRLERVARATDVGERAAHFEQALFLHGDEDVRATMFPPGRPLLPIRPAAPSDATAIGALMRAWSVRNGFDAGRCDLLAERWLTDDVAGFQLIEDAAGIVGLIRLVVVDGRTVDGVEPLLQQHAGSLLSGGRTLFLGAAHCPHPVAHAQLLRHIIGSALAVGRLVVSTAGADYQHILGSLRFQDHGGIRDDTFRCGKPPAVFSNRFTPGELPGWLQGLRQGPQLDRVQATAWALARLRDPALGGSPLLRGSGAVAVADLRSRLSAAVRALAESPDPEDAEAGRILVAYYLGGRRTHVQVSLQLHLSRATYFRRLRHGHAAVAELLRQHAAAE